MPLISDSWWADNGTEDWQKERKAESLAIISELTRLLDYLKVVVGEQLLNYKRIEIYRVTREKLVPLTKAAFETMEAIKKTEEYSFRPGEYAWEFVCGRPTTKINFPLGPNSMVQCPVCGVGRTWYEINAHRHTIIIHCTTYPCPNHLREVAAP